MEKFIKRSIRKLLYCIGFILMIPVCILVEWLLVENSTLKESYLTSKDLYNSLLEDIVS